MSNFSDLDDCNYVGSLNATVRCDFVLSNIDCQEAKAGYVNYVQALYCDFGASVGGGLLLYALWLGFLFVCLGTAAGEFLRPNLESMSKTLR